MILSSNSISILNLKNFILNSNSALVSAIKTISKCERARRLIRIIPKHARPSLQGSWNYTKNASAIFLAPFLRPAGRNWRPNIERPARFDLWPGKPRHLPVYWLLRTSKEILSAWKFFFTLATDFDLSAAIAVARLASNSCSDDDLPVSERVPLRFLEFLLFACPENARAIMEWLFKGKKIRQKSKRKN